MDNRDVQELTQEGHQKLVEELEYRENVKREEILEAIKEARGFGDLSENAEYDSARDEQAHNEARINEIRNILANCKIVSVVSSGSNLSVSIGTTVELKDKGGRTTAYTIVGTTETDSIAHRISGESAAGAAMIGHVVGDVISFTTPTGKVREYTITNISR